MWQTLITIIFSNGCPVANTSEQFVYTLGSGPLQFQCPLVVAIHPHTGKAYVVDWRNQVLNSDLTYSSSFRKASNNGVFCYAYDISTDREGNVFVADCDNHRIQVFTQLVECT